MSSERRILWGVARYFLFEIARLATQEIQFIRRLRRPHFESEQSRQRLFDSVAARGPTHSPIGQRGKAETGVKQSYTSEQSWGLK